MREETRTVCNCHDKRKVKRRGTHATTALVGYPRRRSQDVCSKKGGQLGRSKGQEATTQECPHGRERGPLR